MLQGISLVVGKMSHFYWHGARNKHGGGKNDPFLISVVPGISMVVRIFVPVTIIKRKTK